MERATIIPYIRGPCCNEPLFFKISFLVAFAFIIFLWRDRDSRLTGNGERDGGDDMQ